MTNEEFMSALEHQNQSDPQNEVAQNPISVPPGFTPKKEQSQGGGVGSVIQDILSGLGKAGKVAGKVALGAGKIALAVASPQSVNSFYDQKRKLATEHAANIAQDYFAQTGDDEPANIASHVKQTLAAQGQNSEYVDMNSVLDGVVKQATQNQVYHFDKIRNDSLKFDLFKKADDDAFWSGTKNYINDSNSNTGGRSVRQTSDYTNTGAPKIIDYANDFGLQLVASGVNKKGHPQFDIAGSGEKPIKQFDDFLVALQTNPKFQYKDAQGIIHRADPVRVSEMFDIESINKRKLDIQEAKVANDKARIAAMGSRNRILGGSNSLAKQRLAEVFSRNAYDKNGKPMDKGVAYNKILAGFDLDGKIPNDILVKGATSVQSLNKDYSDMIKDTDSLVKDATDYGIPIDEFYDNGKLREYTDILFRIPQADPDVITTLYMKAKLIENSKSKFEGATGDSGSSQTFKVGQRAVNKDGTQIEWNGTKWIDVK